MSIDISNKIAQTKFPVSEIIRNRWSARSFSEQAISNEDLDTILEAASWAPSAVNEQPWLYFAAQKGSEGFQKIFDTMAGGNQIWAKNAAAYIVSVAKTTFEANQKPNIIALHDVGMANANLLLQATDLGIATHPIGGFDKEKLSEVLQLSENQEPVLIVILGYLDEADKLPDPFRERELTPRTRKSLADFVKKL